MGFSRDTFYRYQTAVESGGVEALIGANRRKPNPKNRVEEIAESAVRSFWLRHNLESFKKRLSALESHVAQTPVKRWPRCRYSHLRESRKMTLRTVKSRPRILAISAARTLFTSARSRAQAEFINKLSYSKWVAAKLYTTKTPITAVDLLNDKVLPFFDEQGMGLIRILTDRGTEYCGKPESHGYPLYLALNDIKHTKTKVRHPQTNGICERFHKTILQEFYQVAFRGKIYSSIEELQLDVDNWLLDYDNDRTHQGKMCCGRTPIQTCVTERRRGTIKSPR